MQPGYTIYGLSGLHGDLPEYLSASAEDKPRTWRSKKSCCARGFFFPFIFVVCAIFSCRVAQCIDTR